MPLSDGNKTAPNVLKLTSEILHESNEQVDSQADILLLILASGSTILGAFVGIFVHSYLSRSSAFNGHELAYLLVFVLLGSIVGCICTLAGLGARGLIRWERNHHHS